MKVAIGLAVMVLAVIGAVRVLVVSARAARATARGIAGIVMARASRPDPNALALAAIAAAMTALARGMAPQARNSADSAVKIPALPLGKRRAKRDAGDTMIDLPATGAWYQDGAQ